MRTPFSNPVILYGNVIANPGVDSAVPNAVLANPLGLPMELLEVRWRLVPQNTSPTASPFVTGLGLGVKMNLGNVPVVNAFTPIGDLGTVRDSYENQNATYVSTTGTILTSQTTYGWRLKYPLFIPAGAVLNHVVRPLGQNAFPVSVDVAYIARTWDMDQPLPSKVKVPWATSFESSGFDYVTNAPAEQSLSTPLDIYNPFDAPLELARLGGRVSLLRNSSGANSDIVNEDVALYRTQLSTLTMRSSRGFDIIRTPAPFSGAFPYNWRTWDVPGAWVMTPGEFYTARISVEAVADAIDAGEVAQAQFSIGVLGFRDVAVSELGRG